MKNGTMCKFARIMSYVMFGITVVIIMYALGLPSGASSNKGIFSGSGIDTAFSSVITVFRVLIFILSAITTSLGVILHSISAPISNDVKSVSDTVNKLVKGNETKKQAESISDQLKI